MAITNIKPAYFLGAQLSDPKILGAKVDEIITAVNDLTDGTISFPTTITDTTASTSKDTGSIITEGGIGVELSLFAGLVIGAGSGSAASPAFQTPALHGMYQSSATELGFAAAGSFVSRMSVAKGFESTNINGTRLIKGQVAPVNSNTDPAPMSTTGMAGGLLSATPAGGINYTLPTGTQMDQLATWVSADESFDFSIINIGAGGTITVVAVGGFTTIGLLTIAANTSGFFRARKTATNTYVLYRLN